MAVRKRGVIFLICFRKRGYPERRGLHSGKGGRVPTLEETMLNYSNFINGDVYVSRLLFYNKYFKY